MSAVEKQIFEDLSDAARLNRVAELVEAIRACHPEDAELVLAVFLEELRGNDPGPDLIEAQGDAEFWAGLASFDQLRAYFIAAGSRLIRYPLGLNGRKRMIRVMLDGMPAPERRLAIAELTAEVGKRHAG